MNNLADRPLVVRATGGKWRRGTQLTGLRKQVIAGCRSPGGKPPASAIPGMEAGGRKEFRSDQQPLRRST